MGLCCIYGSERNKSENPIIEKFKDSYEPLFRKIIDFSDIQTADININLIHYDKNINIFNILNNFIKNNVIQF